MGNLKSSLFATYETCSLRRDIQDSKMGIVKRSGNNSMREGTRGNFENLVDNLGNSGWSLKAIANDPISGVESWLFERQLPGPG